MAEGVEELLTMLYNMVKEGFAVPLGGGRCVVDRNRVLDLIEEINAALPSDLVQARKIVDTKNDILGSAKREADAIKRQAEERARQLVSEQEVLVTARQKANDVLSAAETKSREIRIATNQYVDDLLKRTEDGVSQALSEVRESRQNFKSAAK